MLSLRQFEVFHAVMVHGTVTAAAQALRISQPAASTALRALEAGLGLKLFVRANGRLRPTREAESLHGEVDRVFRGLAVVEKFAHDLKEAHSGVLNLACTPSLASGLLAREIARFRQEHPRVRVWLQCTTTREVVDLAQKRQIDLGVIYSPAEESGLAVEPLYTTEIVCVLAAGHPLAKRRVLGPKQLIGQPLIANQRNDPIAALLDRAFRPLDLRRHLMIGTNNTAAACAMAASGAGVALVEPMSVAGLFPSLVMLPFRPRIALTPRLVYAPQPPLSRAANRFVAQLRAATARERQTQAPAEAALMQRADRALVQDHPEGRASGRR